MNLCSEQHEQVCYEEELCPVCEALEYKDSIIRDLNETIMILRKEVDKLEAKGG